MIISKKQATELGYKNPNLQTILFSKALKKKEIIKWLKQHNYFFNLREETNFYRAMQERPIIGAEFYSKYITTNIIFTFQKF